MSLRETLITATIAGGVLGSSAAAAGELRIDAGADRTARLGEVVTLAGSVSKDAAIGWMKVEGPGQVEFARSKSAETTAVFDQPGQYELMLGGFDGYVAYDTVRVTITP